MEQSMMYGEMVQELTRVRAEYEQFIIKREQERIIKLLQELEDCDWVEIQTAKLIALIKATK